MKLLRIVLFPFVVLLGAFLTACVAGHRCYLCLLSLYSAKRDTGKRNSRSAGS